MNYKDITGPKEFCEKYPNGATFIISPKNYNQLMLHLEKQGWVWGGGGGANKPTQFNAP